MTATIRQYRHLRAVPDAKVLSRAGQDSPHEAGCQIIPLPRKHGTATVPAAGDRGITTMLTWEDAVDRWATALAAAGRSKGTIRLYRHHVGRVARLVPSSPEDVTTDDLRQLLATDWAPETRKNVRTAIVQLFRWLHGEGLLDVDPAARLAPVTVPAGVARPAPEDVIAQALAEAEPRVRAMIMLGAYAGLRAAEIAAVDVTGYDGTGLYITGKGGKTRYVPIVRDDLHAVLRDAQRSGEKWLFPGKVDGHLSPMYVTKLVSAALPDGWTAHTLRHRCATAMYGGTRDLLAVGAVLGHSKPETTQRYIRMPADALTAAIQAAA